MRIKREITGLRESRHKGFLNELLSNPANTEMQHLFNQATYDRIARDEQVQAAMEQRVASVVGQKWRVDRGGESELDREAANFIQEVIDGLDWDGINRQMLWATFYGFSVAEVIYKVEDGKIVIDDIKVRERENFEFNFSEKPVFTNIKGKKKALDNPYFWWCRFGSVNHSELYGRGLANSLYYPVVFKHAGINYWIDFLDKFANPSMIGKTSEFSNNIDDSAELLKTLQDLRGASGAVLNSGEEIDIVESERSGGDYSTFDDRCDSAISKTILGQSMTIEDGTSRSFGKTMLEIRSERARGDDNMVSGSFNRQIIPFLIDSNFKGAKYPKVYRDLEVKDDMESLSRAWVRLSGVGLRPTQDLVDATFGEGWGFAPDPVVEENEDDSEGEVVSPLDGEVRTPIGNNVILSSGDEDLDFADKVDSQELLDSSIDEFSEALPDSMDKMIYPILDFMDNNGTQKTLDKLSELAPQMDIEDLMDVIQKGNELAASLGRSGK